MAEGVSNPGYTADKNTKEAYDFGNRSSVYLTEYEQRNPTVLMKKPKKRVPCCWTVCLIWGIFCLGMGTAMLAGGYDAMFNAILKANVEVKEGSRSYDIWKNTPVPMVLKMYFFNITNPYDFTQGEYAKIEEIGPYTFREYHEKTNLTFHDNHTVTFWQKRWWHWDEELSVGNPHEDMLTQLNTIPVSAAFSVREYPALMPGLNLFLNRNKEQIITNATVMDSLFYGYQDPILDYVKDEIVNENGTWHNLVNRFPSGLTDYDKMAWFYNRNLSETYDGLWNMHTGTDDLSNLGKVDWWNHEHETKFFSYPCNIVSGSAGELWPPHQTKSFLHFYSPDLCMTLNITYQKEIINEYGLKGYRYGVTNETFTNGTVNPENDCYSVDGISGMTGLLNAQSCRMGAPAFISFPHFLHGDDSLLVDYPSLKPDPNKHSFYIDMVPELGVPIAVRARMQINMKITPFKIKLLKKLKETILPILWFEVEAGVTEDLAKELKPVIYLMATPTVTIIWVVMTAFGFLTTVIFSFFILKRKC